jgi:hypothetical protein
MQNWKEPETSTIHLADGQEVSAAVNGISPEDGSGYVLIDGREIKVMPLHTPWPFDWAEVVTIRRNDGSTFEIALDPLQLSEKVLIIDQGDEEVHILFDAGIWREMTEEELEQERRAWSADMKDMEQIKREWRDYRNEGLGERG